MRMKPVVSSFIILITFCVPMTLSDLSPSLFGTAQTMKLGKEEKFEPIVVKVILERMYVDGEISQEEIVERIFSMEIFWAKYDEWELIDMGKNQVVFRKYMDDISPLLKSNGYFGITEDGVLTIFNGKPQKANIIHSFFQIDVGKLESTKHEELKEGIPIRSKDHYVKVLETFKSYSVVEKQAN